MNHTVFARRRSSKPRSAWRAEFDNRLDDGSNLFQLHHAVHRLRGIPVGGRKGPQLAGFCTTMRSLRPPIRGASGDLARLSLAPEIRLPGNRRPPSAETWFEWRKAEHLALARPFGGQVGEANNSHAVRESSFDRSPDEVGCEESERDCHVDLANAVAFPRRDALGICGRFRDELIEPAAPSCDRCDQESPVLGTHWAGVLRRVGCGHEKSHDVV